MKFNENGKRSKAWWLNAVKWFGADGAGSIMRNGNIATYHVRDAVTELERLGLVYVKGNGKTGKGFRGKYYLTATGERYLGESTAELAEPEGGGRLIEIPRKDAVQPGVVHSVPPTPEWKGPAMPGENNKPGLRLVKTVDQKPRKVVVVKPKPMKLVKPVDKNTYCGVPEGDNPKKYDHQHRLTLEKDCPRLGKPLRKPGRPRKLPDAELEQLRKIAPKPTFLPEPTHLVPTPEPYKATKSFSEAFREVLVEILLEKYADQVTAKEVMEKLEQK